MRAYAPSMPIAGPRMPSNTVEMEPAASLSASKAACSSAFRPSAAAPVQVSVKVLEAAAEECVAGGARVLQRDLVLARITGLAGSEPYS